MIFPAISSRLRLRSDVHRSISSSRDRLHRALLGLGGDGEGFLLSVGAAGCHRRESSVPVRHHAWNRFGPRQARATTLARRRRW